MYRHPYIADDPINFLAVRAYWHACRSNASRVPHTHEGHEILATALRSRCKAQVAARFGLAQYELDDHLRRAVLHAVQLRCERDLDRDMRTSAHYPDPD